MTDPKHGGPAFPLQSIGPDFAPGHAGMTMRDWFAGQALLARWGSGDPITPEDAACVAYQMADAMLAERERGNE